MIADYPRRQPPWCIETKGLSVMFGVVWQQLQSFLVRHLVRGEKRGRPHPYRATALTAEKLEGRELLSANQINFNAADSSVLVEGTTDADTVIVWTDTRNLYVRLQNASGTTSAAFAKGSIARIDFVGDAGDDEFTNNTDVACRAWGGDGRDTLTGGSANDQLFGGDGNNVLAGKAGNDELFAGSGNDQFTGGDGDDLLDSGAGDDRIYGGNGDDTLLAGDGVDELRGETGNDHINAGAGADWVDGGADNDHLIGGADNDILLGGDGIDLLQGDAGNDRLVGGDADDRLEGGAGNDRLFGSTGNDYLVGNEDDDELHGEDGNDWLLGALGHDDLSGGAGDDRLYGGDGNDTLTAGDGNDQLRAEAGNDLLLGEAGDDYLDAGLGDDRLFGGIGNDVLHGGDGDDESHGELGNDRLTGGNGNDSLNGEEDNDRLYGGADNDTLTGGGGDDIVRGEAGNDLLFGLDGDDYLDGALGSDRLYGGAGNDVLHGGDANDEVYGEQGNDRITGSIGDDQLEGGLGDDRIYGGDGIDVLMGNEGHDEIWGEGGDDRLVGGDGNDRMDGGANNDRLFGGLGSDMLMGNDGDDDLNGDEDNDRLYGNAGNDAVTGGLGDDLLYGGAGDDNVTGNQGNDSLFGEDGNDRLLGLEDHDTLDGGRGNDEVRGGLGDDVLAGDDDLDSLYGDEGNDRMDGGGGNDLLYAGAGHDVLVGGAGSDALEGDSGNDVLIGGLGVDQLSGLGGEDILIGGTTSFDGDNANLRALSVAWSSAASQSARVQQIEDDLFAARLVSNETVFEDAVADSLFGGADQDWFIQTGYMGVYVPADVHTHDHEQMSTSHADPQHAGPVVSDLPPQLEGFELITAIDQLGDRQSSELIQSLLPHADTPLLQREHLTLFQLVRYDQITHYALHDGDWSDPATWHDGVVPTNGARVLIPMNVEVMVDSVIASRLNTIRVDGTLSFATAQDTELRADTIVVASSGTFEMGTATSPIEDGVTARLIFTNDGPIDRVADPFGLGRGLISHGRVSIHGAETTSHVALASPAVAGAVAITLNQVPVGWNAGDKIVIAATTAGTAQNEVRQIAYIIGNTVYFSGPLDFSHLSPAPELEVHVANITRNIVITSESSAIDRRGHVMFMHNRDVDIAYAQFSGLGRTNKLVPINDSVVGSDWALQEGTGTNQRARYPVHFHRTGTVADGNPSVVRGSVVTDAPGWGFVNHSSYVDMLDNVAFDVTGAAFSTEVGDEVGSFRGNIAIGSDGAGGHIDARNDVQDFGFGGDGFWFQGVGIHVTDNIAAGNAGNSFLFYGRALIENGVRARFLAENLPDPSVAGGAETVDTGAMKVFEFENNIGYASTVGLSAIYLMEHSTDGSYNVLQNSTFWNNTIGVDLPYSHQTHLRNINVIYSDPQREALRGVRGNAVTQDVIFENLTVTGYPTGIALPWRASVIVDGGTYRNQRDFMIQTGFDRNILFTGLTTTPTISMIVDYKTVLGVTERLFSYDVIVLDFGSFDYKRLYFPEQSADHVPFPGPTDGVPSQYIGLTNRQLWDTYGIALGGAIAPDNAYTVPRIAGLIEP
jgi:Ca2+-binding RTX toxin-like protein